MTTVHSPNNNTPKGSRSQRALHTPWSHTMRATVAKPSCRVRRGGDTVVVGAVSQDWRSSKFLGVSRGIRAPFGTHTSPIGAVLGPKNGLTVNVCNRRPHSTLHEQGKPTSLCVGTCGRLARQVPSHAIPLHTVQPTPHPTTGGVPLFRLHSRGEVLGGRPFNGKPNPQVAQPSQPLFTFDTPA